MECSAIMLIEKYKALTVTKLMAASAYELYITLSLPLKVERLNSFIYPKHCHRFKSNINDGILCELTSKIKLFVRYQL